MSKSEPARLTGPVQLANDDWLPITTGVTRAQREQATTTEWDVRLIALARRKRPTVAFWWGVRKLDGSTWAYCYCCDARITTVSDREGISQAKRDTILAHRADHYLDVKDD